MNISWFRLHLQYVLFSTIILVICLLCASAANAATYTWVGTGGNSNWSNANNWDPARTPANDDVLIFDGSRTASASVYVDFASPQIVGQLRFINNIVAVLTVQPNADAAAAPPARQLTMSTVLTGANLDVTAGSSVQVKSPDGMRSTAGLMFHLGAEGTATITGTLIFGSSSTASLTNDPHQLISLKKGFSTIQFGAGSIFRAESTFIGFPFNDKAASSGTVVFRSGSTYEHRGGGAPFGTSLPTAPVTILEKGNRYIYSVLSSTAGPQLPGRSYGYMEYNRPTIATAIVGGSAAISATGLPLVILNDLIITTGNVRLNLANITIQGNLIMNGGTLVNTTGASTVTFNGSSSQLITSASATPVPVSFGSFITVVIDNPAGTTLQTPVQIAKALTLSNGVLNTTIGMLTLLAGATTTANEKSFVSGPLTRVVVASGMTSLAFPLGYGSEFRPLTLSINHSDGAEVRYTAEQMKGRPTARLFTGEINKVSAVRYFNISSNATTNNLLSGSIQLSYGPDDQVDNAEKLRIVKSSSDNQSWEDVGGTGSVTPIGNITSTVPFTSLGAFALASTELSSSSGNNPLPVELISFRAEHFAQGVLVRWGTASEKDNAGFEVERSSDGRLFETIAKVKGQGQSIQKQAYNILDSAPLTSPTAYYRLRQLDFDGASTYSVIVAVKGEFKEELFPNPAQNQFTFRLSYTRSAKYRILASTGQALLEGQTASASTTIDISELPVGFYYLEIETAEGRMVRKFMKQLN
jgi:hypothetical protein